MPCLFHLIKEDLTCEYCTDEQYIHRDDKLSHFYDMVMRMYSCMEGPGPKAPAEVGGPRPVPKQHASPLAGSGKIPWLLLLITEFLGESWPPSPCPCPWWPWVIPRSGPPIIIPGPRDICPMAWPDPAPDPGGSWPVWWCCWTLFCSMLSLCSIRANQRGVLSSWVVFDRSIIT